MKIVEAGEMYGFKIVNIFPEDSSDDDWANFADAISKILDKREVENTVSA